MKLLIENYLSIFLVTICAMLCTSFIRSELEINNARDFHSYCIAVIEASDFDKEAMNKCKEEATKYMEQLAKLPNVENIKLNVLSPALGVHGGPGLLGLSVKLVE